ncbi:MAG: hypothetical protein E2P02_19440 [Acidobacteria bacterium]|nr:MAG: hypothetical protein E2P02_19440 [Acidobacteriota bacterium]
MLPHVVIVGGNLRITLIDPRNFHLLKPLLYQVATGGLSPADIASPLRAVLKHQKNVCSKVATWRAPSRLVSTAARSRPSATAREAISL